MSQGALVITVTAAGRYRCRIALVSLPIVGRLQIPHSAAIGNRWRRWAVSTPLQATIAATAGEDRWYLFAGGGGLNGRAPSSSLRLRL